MAVVVILVTFSYPCSATNTPSDGGIQSDADGGAGCSDAGSNTADGGSSDGDVLDELLHGGLRIDLEHLNDLKLPKLNQPALIYMNGDVNESLASKMEASIELANKIAPSIIIEIISSGGETAGGFKIAKAIENSSKIVTCVVDNEASSMAFYILQSCDIRVMTRRSTLMTHEIKLFTTMEYLKRGRLLDMADELRAMSLAHAEHCRHRMKISMAEYMRRTTGRDWWMHWEDAVQFHAVDRVVDRPKELYPHGVMKLNLDPTP